jgi:putative ATP-dependent endonuclease of the OLD family
VTLGQRSNPERSHLASQRWTRSRCNGCSFWFCRQYPSARVELESMAQPASMGQSFFVRVRQLDISNFRGIQTGSVSLGEFSVLIGQNNSGKTTIVESLALLLGRDRLVRNLTEHDFFGSSPRREDRISIIATVTGFRPNDPDRHREWFRWGRGVEKWRDAQTGALKPLPDSPEDELACQIAFAARFNHDTLDVETVRYFYDDAAQVEPFDENASVTPLPRELIRDLGFFLVPASRTWDRMISFGSELFRRVVSYVGGKPAEAVIDERDRLRTPARPLEEDEKLRDLVSQVNSDITTLFGRPSELKLRLTSTDSEGVLEAVIPHFVDGNGTLLPSRRHGSGLISLQTLILLMRFGSLRVSNNENFLMAVEEPELHVPPPQQRKLLHLMQSLATQAIVTTHSPTVAAMAAPNQLTLVSIDRGQLRATPLLSKLLDTSATNLERGLFLSDRDVTVSAVMHPLLLVPEGKLDARWFSLLARLVDIAGGGGARGIAGFTHEVGVVPTRDSQVVETFRFLQPVHPRVRCLVDGDAQGDQYARQLAALGTPPEVIIRWPDGWAMEDMVGWIIEADPRVLRDGQLVSAGVPDDTRAFRNALAAAPLKGDEVVHDLIADAIATNSACMGRVRHLLKVVADICATRPVDAGIATRGDMANSTAKLWTIQHAIPGI